MSALNNLKDIEILLISLKNNIQDDEGLVTTSRRLIIQSSQKINEYEQFKKQSAQGYEDELIYSKQMLEICSHLISKYKMHELISQKKYDEIAEHVEILYLIEEAIEKIEEVKKNLSIDYTLMEDMLDNSVKTGTLVTFYNEEHRGTGKTTALVKKAHELGAVLVVGMNQKEYVERIANELQLEGLNVIVNCNLVSSKVTNRLVNNGYLIDEMVSLDRIRNLRDFKLLGGFYRVVI